MICRKRRYSSETGAILALGRIWSRKGHHRERFHYECDRCGGRHLTSMPKSRWPS